MTKKQTNVIWEKCVHKTKSTYIFFKKNRKKNSTTICLLNFKTYLKAIESFLHNFSEMISWEGKIKKKKCKRWYKSGCSELVMQTWIKNNKSMVNSLTFRKPACQPVGINCIASSNSDPKLDSYTLKYPDRPISKKRKEKKREPKQKTWKPVIFSPIGTHLQSHSNCPLKMETTSRRNTHSGTPPAHAFHFQDWHFLSIFA